MMGVLCEGCRAQRGTASLEGITSNGLWIAMDELPQALIKCMIDLHGPSAREWLDGLPARIRLLEDRWQIRVSDPFPTLSYHYVAPALRDDSTEVILKLGFPGSSFDREAQCLRTFAGNGAAHLLEWDAKAGAMLLERIRSGDDIKGLEEEEAVAAVAAVMGRLHRPAETSFPFPTVQDWGKGFQRLRDRFAGGCGPLPADLVEQGEEVYADLANSMDSAVLLHGDLHHENILAGERQPWLAIDPQGVIGEPAYELGAYLRNPLPEMLDWPDLRAVMARRVDLFADKLGFDPRRIASWGFAQAVLSGIWSLEDHGSGWESALAAANALRER